MEDRFQQLIKNIDTQVTLNDGQTVVLGGVYEISSQEDISKIPFFGDIPFLGNLSENKAKNLFLQVGDIATLNYK